MEKNNNTNDSKSLKTFFLQRDENGERFGSGQWTDGVTLYVNRFRKADDGYIADVQIKTDETYVNKRGELRYAHKTIGVLKLTQDEATVIVDLPTGKERLTCAPKNVVSSKNNKAYIILNFGDDAHVQVNPYESELNTTNEEAIDSLVDMGL